MLLIAIIEAQVLAMVGTAGRLNVVLLLSNPLLLQSARRFLLTCSDEVAGRDDSSV